MYIIMCVCMYMYIPGVEVLAVSHLCGREGVQYLWSTGEQTDVDHLVPCLLLRAGDLWILCREHSVRGMGM